MAETGPIRDIKIQKGKIYLKLRTDFFNPRAGQALKFLEFHCESHVALDFNFPLEESFLGIHFTGEQISDVIVI